MSRRSLLTSMIFMIVLAVVAVAVPVATGTRPTLGLDLQGGFSVVLQAKEVDGKLPSEEAVEKAKDIIRQRVDGLGVAEPDITRQGHTVVVQLPGVRNREKAEAVVGCTARLEFRPVLARTVNPNAAAPASSTTTSSPGKGSTTTAPGSTTVPAGGAGDTSTTVAPAQTPGTGSGESGLGTVGVAPGEGALPAQFAPTTTTTLPPTTTTEVAPPTTEAPAVPSTTAPATTTTVASQSSGGGAGSTGCGGTGQKPVDPSIFGPQGTAGEAFPSQDG